MLSHFNRNTCVTAAIDNFDHNEATVHGMTSTHDTVCVVFQNEHEYNLRKPKLSDVSFDKSLRSFSYVLHCQKVKEFYKNISIVKLPENYNISKDSKLPKIDDYKNIMCISDFVWILARLDISDSEDKTIRYLNENQRVPSWSSFHSAVVDTNYPIQNVGFLPVLPAPVTEYATAYTSLCNFKDLLSQLNQEFLIVTCDEGVYKIAKHIQFLNGKEFDKIILCLGSFHLTKVMQACIGKYLQYSGINNIFIEAGLFGLCVVDQILSGNHYTRCMKTFTYLLETLRSLQIKEFFSCARGEKYENAIVYILLLKNNFMENDLDNCRDDCKYTFKQLQNSIKPLLDDFNNFIFMRSKESQLFRYWNNAATLISLMLDLVRADRTGNYKLHLETVGKCLPIFHCLDRLNYARWCSVYLGDMHRLKQNAPEAYDELCKGRCSINRSVVPFTSVATDQALEQSNNKFKKSPGGTIRITTNTECSTSWELTFYEFLAIGNSFKDIAFSSNSDNEFVNHHESFQSNTFNPETAVEKIWNLLSQDQYNPFLIGSHELRNICTNELVHPVVSLRILNIFEEGLKMYETFKNARFCDKSKNLSDTLSKNNF